MTGWKKGCWNCDIFWWLHDVGGPWECLPHHRLFWPPPLRSAVCLFFNCQHTSRFTAIIFVGLWHISLSGICLLNLQSPSLLSASWLFCVLPLPVCLQCQTNGSQHVGSLLPIPVGHVLNFCPAPKDEVFPHVQRYHSWGVPHTEILRLLKENHIDTEKYGLG